MPMYIGFLTYFIVAAVILYRFHDQLIDFCDKLALIADKALKNVI